MKVDSVFGAVALLSSAGAVTATVAPLNLKLHNRQSGSSKREVVARVPSTSIPITNSFENFDLQVGQTHPNLAQGRMLTIRKVVRQHHCGHSRATTVRIILEPASLSFSVIVSNRATALYSLIQGQTI
jgi:hypothetical protein